uniref:Uncharacterized protein n=1 Tax=Knipowitschia caucasica TaxID=637954 RepID=A0AAV2JI92_KNICA
MIGWTGSTDWRGLLRSPNSSPSEVLVPGYFSLWALLKVLHPRAILCKDVHRQAPSPAAASGPVKQVPDNSKYGSK